MTPRRESTFVESNRVGLHPYNPRILQSLIARSRHAIHGRSKTMTMTTQEIAERLVALCRQGKFADAQKELYAADVINIEPYATPGFPKETRGLNAQIGRASCR